MKFPCYIYMHTDGSIIHKPSVVVQANPFDYFDSPFVKKWWFIKDNEHLGTVIYYIKNTMSEQKLFYDTLHLNTLEEEYKKNLEEPITLLEMLKKNNK